MTTNTIIIPSSPQDQADIKKVIEDISNSMARADGEKEYQKEAINELSDKHDIPAKYIRRMVKEYHKNEFEVKTTENEDYETLYETIMG